VRRANTWRLALLALTWGSSFLWIALGLAMLAPSWLTVTRLVLGSAVLLSICWARGYPLPRGRATWTHLAVGGILANVAPYFLFALGEQFTSSAYAGILNGTTPLWTALSVLALTRTIPPRLQLAGLALGFTGTILIFEPWQQTGTGSITGITACLAAAALYGISYVYLARYVASQPYNTVALAAGQLGAAAVLSLVLVPLDGGAVHPPTATAVLAILTLGIAGTGLAYVLNYALLVDEGPTATSLVAYLIPIVAAILGVLVLGDQLPPLAGAGAALVLAGVALVRRQPKNQQTS
jgi:drug/metabolite transporter (DMT)-like permease